MRELVKILDQRGISVVNQVNPYGGMGLEVLIGFYKKYRFELVDECLMIRYPKCEDDPDNQMAESYFVVRCKLEDVTDDLAVSMTSVDQVEKGEERYLLNFYEKREGYKLGVDLDDASEDKTVIVIQGRIVTAEEIGLDSDFFLE